MSEYITENAIIRSTMLGLEGHNIMTFRLDLNFGGSGQSFGNWSLDTYDDAEEERVGTAAGMNIIMHLLKVVGVSKWEDLKGKHIRAVHTDSDIKLIGHIMEDKWLNLADFQEKEK